MTDAEHRAALAEGWQSGYLVGAIDSSEAQDGLARRLIRIDVHLEEHGKAEIEQGEIETLLAEVGRKVRALYSDDAVAMAWALFEVQLDAMREGE